MDTNVQPPQVENPVAQPAPVPVNPEPPMPQPMTPSEPPSLETTSILPPSGKKGSPILIVAVILAVIAVLAVVVYAFAGKLINPQPTATIAPIVSTPSPTPDVTANWKKYTNIKNGFEFKFPPIFIYPEEFIASDSNHFSTKMNTDGPREVSGNDLFLEIQTYPTLDSNSMQKVDLALTASIGSILNQPFQPVGKIEKLTENSFKESSPDSREATYYIGLYKKNDTVYTIKLFGIGNTNNNQKLIFDQILSTFKFTAATPSASPTSSSSATPTSSPSATLY